MDFQITTNKIRAIRLDLTKAAMQGLAATGTYKESGAVYWADALADDAVQIADAVISRLGVRDW